MSLRFVWKFTSCFRPAGRWRCHWRGTVTFRRLNHSGLGILWPAINFDCSFPSFHFESRRMQRIDIKINLFAMDFTSKKEKKERNCTFRCLFSSILSVIAKVTQRATKNEKEAKTICRLIDLNETNFDCVDSGERKWSSKQFRFNVYGRFQFKITSLCKNKNEKNVSRFLIGFYAFNFRWRCMRFMVGVNVYGDKMTMSASIFQRLPLNEVIDRRNAFDLFFWAFKNQFNLTFFVFVRRWKLRWIDCAHFRSSSIQSNFTVTLKAIKSTSFLRPKKTKISLLPSSPLRQWSIIGFKLNIVRHIVPFHSHLFA